MLHTPLTIRALPLANRMIAEPIVSNSGDNGLPTSKSMEIYTGYARSGAGMVVVEQHAIHPWGRNKQSQFRLYDDASAEALEPLTALFREQGVPVVAQLNFSGAGASGKELLLEPDFKLASPSGLRNPRDLIGADSQALEVGEIREIVDAFGQAAQRAVSLAKYSGGVQIYACHGYLLGQFLSPLTNLRSDSYGGSIQNRGRLLFEVMEAVKAAVGNYPVSVRLGAADKLPWEEQEGLCLADSVWIAGELAKMGVDWIGVSGNHCIYGIGVDDNDTAYFSPYAKAIREAVSPYGVPVDCAGGIRSAAKAGELLETGVCDLVGFGRPLIGDKDYLRSFEKVASLQD